MLIHKKSKAAFDETLIGDYYVLDGMNIKGKFRISTDFEEDFEYSAGSAPKAKEVDKLEWNRSLIYYIGKDRENIKKRKKELANARKDKVIFRNITQDIKIKGNTIKGLDLSATNEGKIIKLEYEKVLTKMDFTKTPKAMEERFSSVGYGKVIQYGVIINTDYFYYIFENGVRVDLLHESRQEEDSNLGPDSSAKASKSSTKENTHSSSKKASKSPSEAIYDIKYLEDKLNLPASKIRSKLRKYYEKPSGGWKWESQEEVDEVIKRIS